MHFGSKKRVIINCLVGWANRTSADPPSEDPGSCGHSCFDQALSKDLLEFGGQVKVLQASVHRDEQRGKLQLPVLHHEMEQVIGFGVEGDPDILQSRKEVIEDSALHQDLELIKQCVK